MPANGGTQWKRDPIVGALVGAAAIAAFHGISKGLGESAASTQVPWRMQEALLFVCLLSVPGLYLGTITAWIVGMVSPVTPAMRTAEILSVVINAAIYSASWVLVRRGGPGAALRRSVVVTPWLLYAGFAFLQAFGGGSD